jgi:hypothetical protein
MNIPQLTRTLLLTGALAAFAGCTTAENTAAPTAAAQGSEQYRPKLFKRFGEHVNTPDGLAVDKQGNIFLSVPNFVNKTYPASIIRRDAATGRWAGFTTALVHPDSKLAGPMGIEVAEDGNIYYCDNQYFFDKNYKSRILRIVIGPDGEPLRTEPVIENIKLANAVRIRDNAVYFTDTFFDLPEKNVGGVYRVPFSAFKDKPARLLDKPQHQQDPYLLGTTETKVLPHRGDTAGADGMCFDKDGNIYTGTFGDGSFYVLKRKADGTYEKPVTLLRDPKQLPCVDGVSYHPKKDWVIISDSERNAILYWDIKAAKLGTLWQNGDTDGADGLLDQPCETLVYGDKLIIVNFDWAFPGLSNKKDDEVHTLSVIDLP